MTFPEAFVSDIRNRFGTEADTFLNALDSPSIVSVRLNPNKEGTAWADFTPIPWCAQGYYLPERPAFTLDPLLHAGAYYVQEASSMFSGWAFSQLPRDAQRWRVLDMCASPGGKSTHLASLMRADDLLVSNEAISKRIDALVENLERWGYPNVVASRHDPEEFAGLEAFFDVIVIDAPCSGEGMFRKDHDARSEWSTDNVRICSARQKRILTASVDLLREGGYILYSTCTFNEEENDDNIAWLIAEYGLEHVQLTVPEAWNIAQTKFGFGFYPHRVQGEGFYLSVLRKTSGEQPHPPRNLKAESYSLLPSKQLPLFADWLKDHTSWAYMHKPSGDLVILPQPCLEDYMWVDKVLKRKSPVSNIGKLQKDVFTPDHPLAMSIAASDSINRIPLELDDALAFLRKDNFTLPDDAPRGWAMPTYNGQPIGWLKNLGNRFNNYLPQERKIRMRG